MASNAGATSRTTPVHLWIVGVLAVLWNAMGAFDYLATQLRLDFYMRQFSPEQLAYFESFPAWAISGWAFGVWGAFVGSIGLLLRGAWSRWAFAASLAGMAVSTLYTFGMSDWKSMTGAGDLAFMAVIWVVAILLLVYAVRQAKNGVLR